LILRAKVASKTQLPIVIYNFPGVTAGIDLDSSLITTLAANNPSIVGCKLTCGNTGKLARIAASLPPSRFAPIAGKADFLLPGLVAGSAGVISALANVVPKVHVELIRLYQEGNLNRAREIQFRLASADQALLSLGLSGVKAAVVHYYRYGSVKVRSPLPEATPESFMESSIGDALDWVVQLENSL
jgi:4-hydroxy-2-oxoglutarate aldolase